MPFVAADALRRRWHVVAAALRVDDAVGCRRGVAAVFVPYVGSRHPAVEEVAGAAALVDPLQHAGLDAQAVLCELFPERGADGKAPRVRIARVDDSPGRNATKSRIMCD